MKIEYGSIRLGEYTPEINNVISDTTNSIKKNNLEFSDVLSTLVNLLGVTISTFISHVNKINGHDDIPPEIRIEITTEIFKLTNALMKLNIK